MTPALFHELNDPQKGELMELIRRHLASQPSGYAAYLSLQRALMRRHIAKGGTAEDFCRRLSPVYRKRYGDHAGMASATRLIGVGRARGTSPREATAGLQHAA